MELHINEMQYDVGFAALSRSFRVDEKYRITTEDGTVAREVRAVYADFTLELLSLAQSEYDRLVRDLARARDQVTVLLADAQGAVTTYTGVFDGMEDSVSYENEDGVFWDSLKLTFTGTIPLGGSA